MEISRRTVAKYREALEFHLHLNENDMSKQPKLMSDFHKLWLFFDLKMLVFDLKKPKGGKVCLPFPRKNVY